MQGELERSRPARARLVFVAGASRSGTTVLAEALGMHSGIYTLAETHYFGGLVGVASLGRAVAFDEAVRLLGRLLARDHSSVFHDNVRSEDLDLARQLVVGCNNLTYAGIFDCFVQHCAEKHQCRVVVEQTPGNIFHSRELLAAYAGSVFVEIVRDPRAVLFSQRRRWKIRFQGSDSTPLLQAFRVMVNYHAVTMSHLWVSAVESGLDMNEEPAFLSVTYENLVRNPGATLEEICAHMRIDFEPEMLDVPHVTSSIRAGGDGGSGFYASSLGEWERQLPAGDRAICERLTCATARRRGYEFTAGPMEWIPVLLHMLRYPIHLCGILLVNPGRLVGKAKAVYGRLIS